MAPSWGYKGHFTRTYRVGPVLEAHIHSSLEEMPEDAR